MGLLHLEVVDAGHLTVLVNHSLDNVVDLVALFQVLLLRFVFFKLHVPDLVLKLAFVVQTILQTLSLRLSVNLILDLFHLKHGLIDHAIMLLQTNNHKPLRHLPGRAGCGTVLH